MEKLNEKTAIVTGAASGIGRALSRVLAARGAAVVVADIDEAGAQCVAESIQASGGTALPVCVDITDAHEVDRLVRETVNQHGRLDFMFNNAGMALCGEIRDLRLTDWETVLRVNLRGVIHGTMSAYRAMLDQGFGYIINTASLGGLVPEPFAAPYVASKFAVVGLTLSLRLEATEFGIKASVFCPGLVKTRILETAKYVGVPREEAIREMSELGGISPERAVCSLLRGIARNKSIITDSAVTQLAWRMFRLCPGALRPLLLKGVKDMREVRDSALEAREQ
jgi:NAD(P)-dependent dehydrogenase (short-subunit alcohol dehydrogenase family)